MTCISDHTWRVIAPAFVVIAAFATTVALAQETPPSGAPDQFQQVAEFVEKNLIGRTVESETKSKIVDGSLETVFRRRVSYYAFGKSNDQLWFDRLSVIEQQLWDLDLNGNRVSEEPRIKDRVFVHRCVLSRLKSTGAVSGSEQTVSSSTSFPGGGSQVLVRMENERMRVQFAHSFYFDGFAAKDTYRPMASETVEIYEVVGDKLKVTGQEKGFFVDPKTMERTFSGHDLTIVATQVEVTR